MNIVSIDPSIASTAIAIKKSNKMILYNYTTKDKNYKWVKTFNNDIVFRYINYTKYKTYSESEINKISEYDEICKCMFEDIIKNIDVNEPTYIGIEGYSYGSSVGYLVDLVCFSTLLRKYLLQIPNVKKIMVVAPKSLKTNICEIVYGFKIVEEGKRVIKQVKKINTNKMGVKGGDFDKFDMLRCIIDGKIDSPIYNNLLLHCETLLSMSDIKKPIEDIVDAILLNKVVEDKILKNDYIDDEIE